MPHNRKRASEAKDRRDKARRTIALDSALRGQLHLEPCSGPVEPYPSPLIEALARSHFAARSSSNGADTARNVTADAGICSGQAATTGGNRDCSSSRARSKRLSKLRYRTSCKLNQHKRPNSSNRCRTWCWPRRLNLRKFSRAWRRGRRR